MPEQSTISEEEPNSLANLDLVFNVVVPVDVVVAGAVHLLVGHRPATRDLCYCQEGTFISSLFGTSMFTSGLLEEKFDNFFGLFWNFGLNPDLSATTATLLTLSFLP